MRYFLISYRRENKQEYQYGHLLLESENFPSYNSMCKKIEEDFNFVLILNIFEFKNKSDYNSYKSE